MLRPKFAILDELDSGLDVDALRACARRIEQATEPRPVSACWPSPTTAACSTSSSPTSSTCSCKGEIVASGGPELADELEDTGYAGYGAEEAEVEGVIDPFADPFADPFGSPGRPEIDDPFGGPGSIG